MPASAAEPDTTALATAFRDALARLERDADPAPLAALYTDDAVAGNVLRMDGYSGTDGATAFWVAYREQFGTIESSFRNVVCGTDAIAFEWSSTGTVGDAPVTYEGVTVLEVRDGRIRRSCAYFDPTVLA